MTKLLQKTNKLSTNIQCFKNNQKTANTPVSKHSRRKKERKKLQSESKGKKQIAWRKS